MSFGSLARKGNKKRAAKKKSLRSTPGGKRSSRKSASDRLKFVPHKYQKYCIKKMIETGACGLLLDPGLGKTPITLAAIKILIAQGLVSRVLVLAPKLVCYNTWPAEVEKWEDFCHLRTSIVHGLPKKRIAALNTDADIYLMNYENLPWLAKQKGWHFDMLVADESSKFKNTNTLRFKTMKKMVRKFNRRYILTGTPAPRSLMNVFGQIYILDQGSSLGSYITHFRRRYFDQSEEVVATVEYTDSRGKTKKHKVRNWVLKDNAESQIHKAIKHLVVRMDAADYLDLPPLIPKDIIFELPDDAQRIYDQLEDDLIADLSSGVVTAANSAIASQKCRQVANGGIYLGRGLDDALDVALDYLRSKQAGKKVKIPSSQTALGKNQYRASNGRVWEEIHLQKAEIVADLIDELEGQPALVAYEFDHDLARLKKVLGKSTPHIGKGVSMKQSAAIIQAWNKGEIPVLLGQPASMSFGLNMQQAGRAVVYHSMIWDLEAYEQFYKRVWRQGQKEPVFLYHIMAKTRVDFAVKHALQSKHKTQKALLDAFRKVLK